MIPAQRVARIASYGDAHTKLVQALARFPREMWQYRPAPGDFTIHEIVLHITDSEANSFVRARRGIAEPGSAVLGYDEMRWADRLRYHEQSPEDAVELFKWLRGNTWRLVRNLPDGAWAQTMVHSEGGVMTLDDWLDIYERHVTEHIDQMEKVHDAWQRRQ